MKKMASDGRSRLDRDAYRNHNVVGRCFGRLKEYRRIATRYDKTARNYLAMVKLGCIRLFYKSYAIKGHSLDRLAIAPMGCSETKVNTLCHEMGITRKRCIDIYPLMANCDLAV